MNTHIGHKIFQNIPRSVAKFHENRPETSKYMWREKITRLKYNSRPLSLERCAGDCNNNVWMDGKKPDYGSMAVRMRRYMGRDCYPYTGCFLCVAKCITGRKRCGGRCREEVYQVGL